LRGKKKTQKVEMKWVWMNWIKRRRMKKTLEDFSGNKMPAVVFDGATIFWTKTRLNSGINRFAISIGATNRDEMRERTRIQNCWIWGHLLGFYRNRVYVVFFIFIFFDAMLSIKFWFFIIYFKLGDLEYSHSIYSY
jgi:hypothetical protein